MNHGQAALRSGSPADWQAVVRLLQAAGLPTADLAGADALDLWVIEADGSLIGAIGLQRFGKCALLRSLVIAQAHRRRALRTLCPVSAVCMTKSNLAQQQE